MHREKYVIRGGPSGGDGGDGGAVILVADCNENSLYKISRDFHARATNGQPGGNNNCSGLSGETIEVLVPVGTQVFDFERNNCLADLSEEGQRLIVAAGGKGGRGNARFATSTRQSPTYFEEGTSGEESKLRLELKLVADVGLLGLPNAGKSTLMNCVTSSKARVADYPFTTLDPSLGIIDMHDFGQPIVIADIPGIIEGAHEGKGLGHQFLRHIERTRTLALMIPLDSEDVQAEFDALRSELEAYSAELARTPFCLILTKTDLLGPDDKLPEIDAGDAWAVLSVSSVARRGLDELLDALWTQSRRAEAADRVDDDEEWWTP